MRTTACAAGPRSGRGSTSRPRAPPGSPRGVAMRRVRVVRAFDVVAARSPCRQIGASAVVLVSSERRRAAPTATGRRARPCCASACCETDRAAPRPSCRWRSRDRSAADGRRSSASATARRRARGRHSGTRAGRRRRPDDRPAPCATRSSRSPVSAADDAVQRVRAVRERAVGRRSSQQASSGDRPDAQASGR